MAYLLFRDPNNLETGPMVELTGGAMNIWTWLNGEYRKTNALTKIDMGSCTLGQTLVLPGYYTEVPKVLLAPKVLPTYLPKWKNFPQALKLDLNVTNNQNGTISITPSAVMNIQLGTRTETVNEYIEKELFRVGSFTMVTNGIMVEPLITRWREFCGPSLQVSYRVRLTNVGGSKDPYCHSYLQCYMTVYLDVTTNFVTYNTTQIYRALRNGYDDTVISRSYTLTMSGNDVKAFRLRIVPEDGIKKYDSSTKYTPSRDYYWMQFDSFSYGISAVETVPLEGEVYWLAVGR
jgi:hypothetical protein